MLPSCPRISRSSFPVSRVSISASRSASRAIRSPSRRISRARPNPVSWPHGPVSARRAAATAVSTSAASPSAALAHAAPRNGSTDSYRRPDAASVRRPSMNSVYCVMTAILPPECVDGQPRGRREPFWAAI